MSKYYLLIMMIFVTANAFANEQKKAIDECKAVSAKAMEKEQSKLDLVALCPNTDRSYEFWVCMNGRVTSGETFLYAFGQCDTSPERQ